MLKSPRQPTKSFFASFFSKKEALAFLLLSSCAIHQATPYVPDITNAPQTADAADASANCTEASTPAETAICAAPALVADNHAMIQALHADLRSTTIFGRDALLADQRAWTLALPETCHLPNASAAACLQAALSDQTAALRAWPARPAGPDAVAQYVMLRPPAGAASQPDPAFCADFTRHANAALQRTGTLDPAAMGYAEVAGTHGPEAAPPVRVDLYDANVFALFQRRARSVALGAAPVITPVSLTQLAEAQSIANQGGRFSSFASQTGDYGSIDVFRAGARLLALAADPWGSTTPASPGEAAHAGVWDLTTGAAVPLCLFDTYIRPAEPGPFDTLQNFAAWRDVLAQIRDADALPLGIGFLRDQGQLTADTNFVLLHMPLLARAQATGGWVAYLRHRHDEVLDALFAWSGKSPANKALFDRALALLRPAAAELVRAYQTTEGLSGPEATQAGGIAVMELLYEASVTVAPGLGASSEVPVGYRPKYPILAAPQ